MASAQQALVAAAPVHRAVPTATAQERKVGVPSALAEAPCAHDAGRQPPPVGSACAPRFEHDFGRLRVHERSAPALQPKLFIGAPGDRFEQEADAVAEQVMRGAQERPAQSAASRSVAPLQGRASAAGGFEPIQRQSDSPFSIDDGLLTEADGEPAGDAAPQLQAKLAPGGQPEAAPGVAGRIEALRAQGSPLPAPVRSFMETRFGHDFGKVRVHTGSAATAVAARINARAFTVGRDIVFGDGQFASHSAAGQRLIAHELTHVVQQGHAPRLSQAGLGAAQEPGADVRASQRGLVSSTDPQARVIRRVKWHPNKSTGKNSAPWGSGGPTGEVLKGKTDAGTAIDIWHPDDGQTYWCHGYTFGGMTAKGGPYSVWGETVPTVLKDDGWKQTLSCMAQASDILVFWDAQGMVTHSGIIRTVTATGGRVDDATSMLESKWGSGAHNTSSWETNAKSYGRYRCFSKAPVTGVCSGNGASER